jgi:hypothetical protein
LAVNQRLSLAHAHARAGAGRSFVTPRRPRYVPDWRRSGQPVERRSGKPFLQVLDQCGRCFARLQPLLSFSTIHDGSALCDRHALRVRQLRAKRADLRWQVHRFSKGQDSAGAAAASTASISNASASASLSSSGAKPLARIATTTVALSALPLPVACFLIAPTGVPE